MLQDAKAACEDIVDDPAYRANLKAPAINGKLAPAIEVLLWQYAKGKRGPGASAQSRYGLERDQVSVGNMTV